MEHDTALTPISNRFGMMRTPTWINELNGNYSICVGIHTYRYFTEETLPNGIKSLLAMVKAFPFTGEMKHIDRIDPEELRKIDMMCYIPPNSDQECVGWRLSQYSFILVLDKELFEEVRDGRYPRKQG